MAVPALHADLEPLAFLFGTWRGEGKADYPTIQPFSYGEEIRFWHVGKPFLLYTQWSWLLEDGAPSHSQMGYWRPVPDHRIELVLAHGAGFVEVAEGTVSETRIEVASTLVGRTGTAKEVTRLERTFTIRGDVLAYELRMAAVGVPLVHHSSAELRRVEH